MNARFNRIAASTAAAVALAFTGAAFAGDGVVKSKTTTTSTTTTNEAKLGVLNGATIRDANGNAVGTVQSYQSADGNVTATVVNSAGVSSTLPLGATETIVTDIPASGSVAITVGSDGTVQYPFTATEKTTTETSSTTVKTPTSKSKTTTSTTTQQYK
jgi:hypothetical protein